MKNANLRRKLTNVDFSEHKLQIIDEENVTVHSFKKPGTVIYNIKFINTQGICAVTGDVGNWIFCREFHPSEEGFVSPDYWVEKLIINSTQKPMEYDREATKKQHLSLINGGYEEYGYDEKYLDRLIKYSRECIEYCENEWEYKEYSYQNIPTDNRNIMLIEYEDVVFCEKIKYRLQIVFDAFNEICNIIENEYEKSK